MNLVSNEGTTFIHHLTTTGQSGVANYLIPAGYRIRHQHPTMENGVYKLRLKNNTFTEEVSWCNPAVHLKSIIIYYTTTKLLNRK